MRQDSLPSVKAGNPDVFVDLEAAESRIKSIAAWSNLPIIRAILAEAGKNSSGSLATPPLTSCASMRSVRGRERCFPAQDSRCGMNLTNAFFNFILKGKRFVFHELDPVK